MTSFVLLAVVLSFAIIRIRAYSRVLVENKIFANEKLMCVHLLAFVYLGVLILITGSDILAIGHTPLADMSTRELRFQFACVVLGYAQVVGCFSVVLTMVIMFVKHSLTLTDSQHRSITKRFLLVFAPLDKLDQINDQRIEQHYA